MYFQWGDTQGYTASQCGSGEGQKAFSWADYKYWTGDTGSGSSGMTKYNSTDGKKVLEASDDAVTATWGGQWRMPTKDEYAALGNAVNTAWTQVDGVYGMLCTDKTDSSKILFFPACGSCSDGSVIYVGSRFYYWSSSLVSSSVLWAYYLHFNDGRVYWDNMDIRCHGFTVRGVLDE